MRATAQIFPIALPVNRHFFLTGDGSDDFSLIFFANLAEMGDRLGSVPNFADNRFIAVNNFTHPRFNSLQIIKAERRGAGEIIIKAVFNHRPYCYLRIGK